MSTLYELELRRDSIQAELDAILETTGGEVTDEVDALFDRLLMLDMQTADKFDNYGHVLDDLTRHAEALRNRMLQLQSRLDVIEKTRDRMKSRLKAYMERHDLKKVEGEWYVFRVQKNGGKVPVEIQAFYKPEDVEERFQRTKVEFDRDAIRQALEAGEALEFASLGERGTSLRIQ